MKKITLIICLFATLIIGCEKNSSVAEPVNIDDTTQSEIIEDVESENVEESDDYQEEGTMKIDSITGDKAPDIRNTWGIFPFKYTGFLKIGKNDNAATLTINLSKRDSDFVSVATNFDTLVTVSNLTKINDTKYTITCQSIGYAFTAKNIKFTFTSSRSVNSVPKTFVKSVKCVGVNELGNIYGTQLWGLNTLGLATIPVANGTNIDSSYMPEMGDRIGFDYDEMRGIITSTPIQLSIPPETREVKGRKYEFQVTQFNARGKGAKTVKKYKLYQIEFKQTALKFLSPSKAEVATKYWR